MREGAMTTLPFVKAKVSLASMWMPGDRGSRPGLTIARRGPIAPWSYSRFAVT